MKYGSTSSAEGEETPEGHGSGGQNKMQKFTIDETPSGDGDDKQPLSGNQRSRCDPRADGLRTVTVSAALFAVGIAVALIVQVLLDDPAASSAFNNANKVVSNDGGCSSLGETVINAGGGNAIDAVVATAFCVALAEPHISGLGGGGVMLLHRHRTNSSVVIDFGEAVPKSAATAARPTAGRLSIGVPGFVKGLEFAHGKYGSGRAGHNCCSWADLVYMAIRHALKRGIVASGSLSLASRSKITDEQLSTDDAKNLRRFLSGSSSSSPVLTDNAMFRQLVKTLQMLADEGPGSFYQEGGSIAKDVVAGTGGRITENDLKSYRVVEREPVSIAIGNFRVFASPSPSSGPKLLTFLSAMEKFRNANANLSTVSPAYLEHEAELLLALQAPQLGLVDDAPERTVSGGDPVASHLAAMDDEDNYVTMATSINTWFGSTVMTDGGILLNNALANFRPTPAENGTTADDARLLTRNVVTLVTDTLDLCGSRMLTGGASADAVGQVLLEPLRKNVDLMTAVDSARIMVRNDTLFLEGGIDRGAFPAKTFQTLLHRARGRSEPLSLPYSAVNILVKNLDTALGYADLRSDGGETA